MAGCVSEDHHDHDHTGYDRRVLWIAFALNFPLFLLELWQGLQAGSTSLIADSMDFLSDSASYLITMYVLTKPLHVRARASIFKAWLMLALAAGAIYQGVENVMGSHIPAYGTMGWVAMLALVANVVSALLLYKTRGRDSNMRSIWLCSRNDALANIFIMVAAGLVYATGTLWPDLAVALIIMWLEGSAAVKIIRHARSELGAELASQK